ncbi:GntR family transcriptional regulator [Ramlibacter terrae]|uniref:GntR family transcriptional regulator n=1 Tax=Ramlibacter terrae TaxID=2732511 RepID=A0ABX6P3J0_9BURK|nr:GntR family transcriptional regulator [Ramlibacter terrae]
MLFARSIFIAEPFVYAYNPARAHLLAHPDNLFGSDPAAAPVPRPRALVAREPLRQEEIAAELGVSRVPVREAFFQLQAEGLVQVVPNKGVYVRSLSADNLSELFRLRRLLEADVLGDAVPLHTTLTLNRIETIRAALDKARTVGDWLAGDREFHEALYAPAERPETLAIIRRLRFIVDRFYFSRLKPSTRAQGWHEEHHALIRAVRRRDAKAAAKLLSAHLEETERSALAALAAA